jgi:DNA processing protein
MHPDDHLTHRRPSPRDPGSAAQLPPAPQTPRPAQAEGRDVVRAARAALAWLLGPVTPAEAYRISTEGPVQAWTRIATDPRVAAELDRPAPPDRHGPPDAQDPQTWYPHRLPSAASQVAQQTDRLRVVIPEDPEWPATLERVAVSAAESEPDRPGVTQERYVPLCLWVRGRERLADVLDRSVAVVGARAATEYGKQVAERLGVGLAERGVSVVTTGGYGIDTAALRGSIDGEGVPVAALPSSLDRAHPRGNTDLFDAVAEQGVLVSAWPPGHAAATRSRLVANHRMVAALTRGTVLVEAGHHSGTLITLHQSIALHRPAMVVPGPVTSPESAGAHHALRTYHATRLVTGADDVVADLDAS